ncbi:MAG TPA: nuclear transport factor 2 family protein [Candidatus Limnocylindrales bacterium]|nr:nuclear transport factor 2 family protein [Candidatus Limnocylindrales bacterium]
MRMLAAALGILLGALTMSAEAQKPAPKTLTGVQAQKSPQADVFLAYEEALLSKGIDAAGVHMTPERLADMKEQLKQGGEAGFKEFQAKQRESVAKGEARRKQIEKVIVDGDTATLEARSSPAFVDEVRMVKTKDGWKIGKGRF